MTLAPGEEITPAAIRTAALAIAREGGEAAVTIRAVAAHLGRSHMGVYGRAGSIEELRADMLEAVVDGPVAAAALLRRLVLANHVAGDPIPHRELHQVAARLSSGRDGAG